LHRDILQAARRYRRYKAIPVIGDAIAKSAKISKDFKHSKYTTEGDGFSLRVKNRAGRGELANGQFATAPRDHAARNPAAKESLSRWSRMLSSGVRARL